MREAGSGKAIDEFLATYPPETQTLALATREFVLQTVPGTIEVLDTKARVIGYGFSAKYTDMICVIMPTKVGVTLGIGWAMELPDPEKLLEGTGKVHRHVKLKQKSDLERPALKALVEARVANWKKAST